MQPCCRAAWVTEAHMLAWPPTHTLEHAECLSMPALLSRHVWPSALSPEHHNAGYPGLESCPLIASPCRSSWSVSCTSTTIQSPCSNPAPCCFPYGESFPASAGLPASHQWPCANAPPLIPACLPGTSACFPAQSDRHPGAAPQTSSAGSVRGPGTYAAGPPQTGWPPRPPSLPESPARLLGHQPRPPAPGLLAGLAAAPQPAHSI